MLHCNITQIIGSMRQLSDHSEDYNVIKSIRGSQKKLDSLKLKSFAL